MRTDNMDNSSNELSPEEAKLVLKSIEETERQEADEQRRQVKSISGTQQPDQ